MSRKGGTSIERIISQKRPVRLLEGGEFTYQRRLILQHKRMEEGGKSIGG